MEEYGSMGDIKAKDRICLRVWSDNRAFLWIWFITLQKSMLVLRSWHLRLCLSALPPPEIGTSVNVKCWLRAKAENTLVSATTAATGWSRKTVTSNLRSICYRFNFCHFANIPLTRINLIEKIQTYLLAHTEKDIIDLKQLQQTNYNNNKTPGWTA